MKQTEPPSGLSPSPERGQRADGSPPRVRLQDLTGGARVLVIEHQGEDYTLRVTARGKLILNK